MSEVTSRPLVTKLYHDEDGKVTHWDVQMLYEWDHPANPGLKTQAQEWVAVRPDDLTAGDKTANSSFSTRVKAGVNRVRPLVLPQE